MTDPNRWESGDPIADIRTFMEWSREATWLTKIEMTMPTLNALRVARAGSNPLHGQIGDYSGVPIHVTDDLPDGKARICWSSGVEQVIP